MAISLRQILNDWIKETFNIELSHLHEPVKPYNFIEYKEFILIVFDEKRQPDVRIGCPHVVCLNDFALADPDFFIKIKPAIQKRKNYIDSLG